MACADWFDSAGKEADRLNSLGNPDADDASDYLKSVIQSAAIDGDGSELAALVNFYRIVFPNPTKGTS